MGGGGKLSAYSRPLAGGGLINLLGWRGIFLVNLPIGLGALWLTWRHVDETPRLSSRGLDLLGQVTAIAALGCLAGAIIEGGAKGWGNPWVLAGFPAAVVLALLFVLQERRVYQPMLPLSLFGVPLFSLTCLIGLLVNIAFYGLIFVLSLYFQQVNGFSAMMTGFAFLPMMTGVLVVNLVAPRIAERFGARVTISTGSTIAAAGCVALVIIAPHTAYAALGAQLLALGGGLGLLVPPLTSTLLGSVEVSRSGLAAGVLNATRQTGSVLGVALFGSLLGTLSLLSQERGLL